MLSSSARILRSNRALPSRNKRLLRYASPCGDVVMRSFASGSEEDKELISDRDEVRFTSPRIESSQWPRALLQHRSPSLAVSPSTFRHLQRALATAVVVDTPCEHANIAVERSSSLCLSDSVSQSAPLSDLQNEPPVDPETILSPRAMKRLMYSSTIRALGLTGPCTNDSPFQQTMHRVVQRACFSTQPESKDGTSNSNSNDSVPTPQPSASFSTSTTSADEHSLFSNPPSYYVDRARDAIVAASKSIVNFILKLPGVTWFYLTHPREFIARLHELKEAAKKEAHHYYMGSKLLVADVKTAYSMLKRTLQGSALSRRERKQLLRTVSDLFRLVPFSMFVLIPFMEFALPFALRLFPNMLPSTFQDSLKAEESMKRELTSRIAMAAFFQETLQDLVKEQQKDAESRLAKNEEADNQDGKVIAAKQEESAKSMLEFLGKARNGEMIPPEVIIQYATFFQDDLTLDNMPRMQLINMCKYMNIPPYGSDAFLRFQLRHKIRTLKEDDQRILWEGIDSLTKMELREACQDRGMRSTGLSKDGYKRSLQQWLNLSVNKNVPISLLIMSRTFFLRDEMTTVSVDDDGSKSMAGLADAISGLDKDVVNEVVLEVATSEEKKRDPDVMKIKLEVLEQQNERIREEQEERDAAAKKKEMEKEEKEKEKQEAAREESSEKADVNTPPSLSATTVDDTDITRITTFEEEKEGSSEDGKELTQGPLSSDDRLQEGAAPVEEEREEEETELSPQEMDAISQLANPDPVNKEREDLARIKAAMQTDDEEPEVMVLVPDGEQVFTDGNIVENESREPHDAVSSEQVPSAETTFNGADEQTTVQMEKSRESETQTLGEAVVEVQERKLEGPYAENEGLEKAINRLKSKVESMVDKIETQLSDVEVKIGDKLHFLDKDMDGIVSREEMALCLQQVLKRELTFEEALSIAAEMDADNDGVLTVAEFISWIDTHKLVNLLEEGRDTDIDSILAKYHQKEDEETSKHDDDAKEAT